ncbi:putative Outer membrane protein-like protein [Magnetofaba australis IT-1]|uniref:Putative Outer membrane protein-like protein n=2 Tax=Magnetofaba TaxID=1472292 RepID=A0A1Y2K419_9PROT|nr:putative Outer membrane protein-like protein [Magnetofaba australis IT-1]
MRRNKKLSIEALDRRLADEAVTSTRGRFEPTLTMEGSLEESMTPNNVEQATYRSYLTHYYERYKKLSAEVATTLPSGAEVSVESTLDQVHNNLQTDGSADADGEYETFLGITFTQPLLKGAGPDATLSSERIAKQDAKIAYQKFRLRMMGILHKAITAYWKLRHAQDALALRQASTVLARKLLADGRARSESGKLAHTGLLPLLVGVSQRQAQQSVAEQALAAARSEVAAALFLPFEGGEPPQVVATEPLDLSKSEKPNVRISLEKALSHRPEILSARHVIDREKIRVVYLKNQDLPQLDLSASFGVNGLGYSSERSYNTAFHDGNEAWTLGVTFSTPLYGGIEEKSALASGRITKRKALLELRATEVEITSEIHAMARQVQSAAEQLRLMRRIETSHEKQWRADLAEHAAGMSDYARLLEQEALLINARENALQHQLRYRQAVLGLMLAEGALLTRLGVEEESAYARAMEQLRDFQQGEDRDEQEQLMQDLNEMSRQKREARTDG